MFDFIKNRFGKKSHGSQSRDGLGSKLSKRDLFLEPLEDRRLLAADFSLSVSDGDVTEVGARIQVNSLSLERVLRQPQR